MPSIVPGFEYDIFISYRHKDNKGDQWVTDFVKALKTEIESTFKEDITIYFDNNAHDGLLETHHVDKSLEGKLKCLVFIPIISQTYCDIKSFAWQNEFCAFNKLAKEDQFGRDIKLLNGNVTSRILPIKIHDLDAGDKMLLENELGGVLRAIEFIFKSPGVNRPLRSYEDHPHDNLNKTFYRDQINKVANSVKEIIQGIKTPSGNESSIGGKKSKLENSKESGRSKMLLVSLVLIILFSVSYWLFFSKKPAESAPSLTMSKSLVVLPFEDLSPNKDQEWFTDGLTEELLNGLSAVTELKLISRTTAFSFKGKGLTAKKIADSLGVSHVLEGSVRKANDMIRITVQLIKASDDSHLWSRTYDYGKDSIFKVQEDISKNVTSTLNILLDPASKENMFHSGTANVDAYEEYLKGIAFSNDAHEGGKFELLTQANVHFENAIELDNQFAGAYYNHADLYTHSILGSENSKILKGLTDEYMYEKMMNDIKMAILYVQLPKRKISYELAENFLSTNWSHIPSFVKDRDGWRSGWDPILILVDPDFVYKRYANVIRVDQFNDIARFFGTLALLNKNQLDSALAMYSTYPPRTYASLFAKSIILKRKKEYTKAFDLINKNNFSRDFHYLLLKLLAGKYKRNHKQLNHSLDSAGFDINSYGMSTIQIYNALGDYEKADAVARKIDSRLLSHCTLSQNIITYGLGFHLNATPNFVGHLRELGIDPVEFEKKNYYQYPKVHLKH